MMKTIKLAKAKDSPEERKKTVTAFLLMFPSLIIGIMAMIGNTGSLLYNFLILALLIYQFVMLEQFIKDFYKTRGY